MPRSDISYGGIPISPMGHARHLLGVKELSPRGLGIIGKHSRDTETQRNNKNSVSLYLCVE